MDLWPVDIRRFGLPHADDGWVRSRTLELYGKHYTIAWPSEEHDSGRPLRRSPLYERLRAAGAVFGEKLGWERANWFAQPGRDEPRDVYGFGRPNWFEAVGEEHRACRERVALFDASSFAKFLLVGQGAEAALSWICAGDVARPPGCVVYTQMLNAKGGIECDLTVTRLAVDTYYIVTGTGFATRDFAWIARNLPEGADARLLDVTSAFAVLPVMGPRARALLGRVTSDDVSNAAFPFGAWREIHIAGAPVRALRVTYVGELGYELHLPVEFACAVYDALLEAGRELGLAHAGYRAIEIAAPGEGLPRLGRRHRPRLHAARGRARLRREARHAATVPRARGARAPADGGTEQAARLLHGGRPGCGAARPGDDLSRRRSGRLAQLGRLRLHGGKGDRLRLRAPWRSDRRLPG